MLLPSGRTVGLMVEMILSVYLMVSYLSVLSVSGEEINLSTSEALGSQATMYIRTAVMLPLEPRTVISSSLTHQHSSFYQNFEFDD